jgi:HlyD family secretion protein
VLTAPGAGVVTGRYREPGELAPAGRPVLTVADPAAPWVRVYVNQLVLPDVRVGQRGTARLDGPRPSAFAGRVIAISREAEYTPRIALTDEERADLMFGVKLALDDPHGRLRAGLPVTVTLTTADGAHPTGARPRAVALTEATP